MTILQKKKQIENKERYCKIIENIIRGILLLVIVLAIIAVGYYLGNTASIGSLAISIVVCIIIVNVVAVLWVIYDYFIQTRVISKIKEEKNKISIAEKYYLTTEECTQIKKADCKESCLVKYYAKLMLDDKKMYIEIYVRTPTNEMTVLTKTDNFEKFAVYYNPNN